jgi:hypothetical protein
MHCWSCLFEGEAKEANFDVSVRSHPGDVGQWFAPTKLRPFHVEISSQDSKKEETSKQASIEVSTCTYVPTHGGDEEKHEAHKAELATAAE